MLLGTGNQKKKNEEKLSILSHFELNNIHERSDFFTDFVKKINNWNERAAVGL